MFLGTATSLNTAFGTPTVQPTSTITQPSNWWGDTFVQPWVDFGSAFASSAAKTVEEIAGHLPTYFAQKWGILPKPAATGGTSYPQPQPAPFNLNDYLPDWARQLLPPTGTAYQEARGDSGGNMLLLGMLAVGIVILFCVMRQK